LPLPELQLLERIRNAAKSSRSARVRVGIGDDCAVLRTVPAEDWLVTTDLSLQGVHFRLDCDSAEAIGHRVLLRGLSDIAAMGGEPVAAFLSLAVPSRTPQRWVDDFTRGLLRLARRYKVELAGGDTAESRSGIVADIVVVGRVPRGDVVLRSGAQVGDEVYVTGHLGESAGTLAELKARRKPPASVPEPRVAVGRWLRAHRAATAMIDLSDGLSTDLAHICQQSKVGAVVEASAIPLPAWLRRRNENKALALALHGGEDYELLFTARPSRHIPRFIAGVRVTRIGRIVDGRRVWLQGTLGKTLLRAKGWQHFTGRS